ncbi:MAG: PilZ domain-containing protein [Thiogranum sp.]|nr:PilZ domain-containing protein [Thiogranum sp.]
MARLTLSFKERKLKVFALPEGDCVVGRDPDCSIVIDSLAVAPQHARIRAEGERYFIEPIDAGHPVMVGQQPVAEAQELSDGDSVQIGKHSLRFSTDSDGIPQADVTPLPAPGCLQIQSGSHMGRTIRLHKAFTRIGRPDGELAVIAHRDNGYYLSALHGEQGPQVNGRNIGESSCKLHDNDNIFVGELQVRFFADGDPTQTAEPAPTEQRHFSRIPFHVNVTLGDGQQTWEGELLDISLHGALVKAPAAFAGQPQSRYQLAIHLEGGPDICMDVEIAHRENDELGLNCKDIDVDSITHLRRLVELNLGDPELLERELSALG